MEEVDKLVKEGSGKFNEIEFAGMMENLKVLDAWCRQNNKEGFFRYFEDAMIGAYYRYRSTKDKVWPAAPHKKNGKKKKRSNSDGWRILKETFLDMIPTVSISSVITAVTVISSLWSPEGVDWSAYRSALILCVVIGIPGTMILNFIKRANDRKIKLEQDRKYYETWVRHSLCNSRLSLALGKFVVSSRMEADFQELVDSTFAILEQNLDQFAVNTSPNGMAAREGNNEQKG